MTGSKKDKKSRIRQRRLTDRQLGLLALAFSFLIALDLTGGSCFFASVFGIPCAGCGSSRALLLLLQGRFKEAIRMHPLILLSLAILLGIPLYLFLAWYAKKRGRDFQPLTPRTGRILLFSLIALYLLVYLIRMILYFPHTEPMCYREDSLWGRLILLFKNRPRP